jgi:formylglycine-generating enzyme required for sulfatase activity
MLNSPNPRRIAFPGVLLLVLLAGCNPGSPTEDLPALINVHGIELVLVPQGKQLIGTNNSRAWPHERPARWFELDYPLYMSRTEVTADQWRFFSHEKRLADLAGTRQPNEPMTIDWETGREFLRSFRAMLEMQTKREWEVRYPREAEWEYAACYGRPPEEDWWPMAYGWVMPDHDRPWAVYLDEIAWYEGNSDGHWHPVGQKEPNPLGLYDMIGNVSEWCEGWRTDSVSSMLTIGWKEQYPGDEHCPWLRSRPGRGPSWSARPDDSRPSSRVVSGVCGIRIVAIPR